MGRLLQLRARQEKVMVWPGGLAGKELEHRMW